MKAQAQTESFLNQNQPLCQNQLNGYSLLRLLLWLRSSIKSIFSQISQLIHRYAHQVIPDGLTALAKVEKRKVVGCVLLVVGVFGVFSHQLLFNEADRDYTWYYLNWYYFLFTLRPWIVLTIWSAAFILFIPKKYTLAFIPFSLFNSIGWCGLLHYSFFVDSNESFHTLPAWPIIVAGLVLGFSIVMSLDALLYWYNHKALGNWCRHVGITEMKGLTPEQKEPMYQSLAKEFRQIQKMI